MMGAGKSRSVPCWRRLGRRFIDTDLEVERAVGSRVAEIFEREGEPAFRGPERDAIEACCGRPPWWRSAAGRSSPGRARALPRAQDVIYLRARPALLARVGDAGGRPLLKGLSPAAQAKRLAGCWSGAGRLNPPRS
jgi:shikimate kinase